MSVQIYNSWINTFTFLFYEYPVCRSTAHNRCTLSCWCFCFGVFTLFISHHIILDCCKICCKSNVTSIFWFTAQKTRKPFFKAYRPLAQQYFSAGLVWSLPWGGVGPLPPPLLGGGGPLPPPLLGVSHVTYPIMLLYTTIEFLSASWAKFTWGPP